MIAFYLTCFVLGGLALIAQLILSAVGADADHHVSLDHGHGGLDLLSVRTISAAAGFFGLVGFGMSRAGFGFVIALTAAVAAGFGAALGMATLLRAVRRLEVDKSFDIASALGLQGRVYLGIPANKSGVGKVHLTVHDRLLELAAVSPDVAIPSGTEILVVDTQSSDTLIVTPSQPLLREIDNVE
ncbi:MAG: hypothetical protein IT361_01455 [Gemmatimonadaceae bacterium]|nr:hypothetical protein [Gemmatimonadaceae bacterium]